MNVDRQEIEPGGVISGDARPGTSVRLEFRSSGRVTEETAVLREAVADSNGRFELAGPMTPLTYSGKHFKLDWHLVAGDGSTIALQIDREGQRHVTPTREVTRHTRPWSFPFLRVLFLAASIAALSWGVISSAGVAVLGGIGTALGLGLVLTSIWSFLSRRRFGATRARVQTSARDVGFELELERGHHVSVIGSLDVVEQGSRHPGPGHALETFSATLFESTAELALGEGLWRASIELPANLPPSFLSRHCEIIWSASFRIVSKGLPDEVLHIPLVAKSHPDARAPAAISIPRAAQ